MGRAAGGAGAWRGGVGAQWYLGPMPPSDASRSLSFAATLAVAVSEDFGGGCVVHGLHFGGDDLEGGVPHWSFSRLVAAGAADGVCTVREPQDLTFYDGIAEFRLGRDAVEVRFDAAGALQAGAEVLMIGLAVDEAAWAALADQAELAFAGRPGLRIAR